MFCKRISGKTLMHILKNFSLKILRRSREGVRKIKKMAEESDMRGMIKTEEGDDLCSIDRNEQPLVLLLRVMQANGKPLPTGGFTTRAMSQMLHEVAGAISK